MASYKKEGGALGRALAIATGASALVAFAVYFLTLDTALFPGVTGESTSLMVQWTGLDLLSLPEKPLWGWFVSKIGAMGEAAGLVWRVNFFSLVCGVVSAALVCRLAAFFAYQSVTNEETVRFDRHAALAAGIVSAVVFIFSQAVWQGATHLEYRMFHTAWALALAWLFIPMSRSKWLTGPLSLVLAVGTGLGAVDSAVFIVLAPVFAFALAVHCRKMRQRAFGWVVAYLLVSAGVWFWGAYAAGAAFEKLPQAASSECKTAMDAMFKLIDSAMHELVQWFKRPDGWDGWPVIMALAPFPFAAAAFAAPRGLNNERTLSQYLFHIGLTLLSILAIATTLAPVHRAKAIGVLPIATTTLVALTAGYLAAYWLLMFLSRARVNESVAETAALDRFGRFAAPVAGGILAGVSVLTILVNAFACTGDRNSFADKCAREILRDMGEREWLATNGRLDDHIRVEAARQGRKVNLVCLWRDSERNKVYLDDFAKTVAAAGLKGGPDDLAMVVRNMGVAPFLQDWMKNDPDAPQKLAVYGMPDIWCWADYAPVPHGTVYLGVKDVETDVDFDAEQAFYHETWDRLRDELVRGKETTGTYAAVKERDRVELLRLALRGAMGMNGVNLGVALADAKRDDAAFAMFDFVLKKVDPDNISAMLNEFELARAGNAAALRAKGALNKLFKKIEDDQNRRYQLYSLGTTYGYVRNALLFVEMGRGWARSGVMGAARAQIQRARDLLPEANQAALLNILAAMYSDTSNPSQAREIYQKNLEADSTDRAALMGLAGISLKEGNLAEARDYAARAAEAARAASADGAGVEFVLLNLLDNDLDAARVSMQRLTDANPNSTQAWAMLSGILLQQHDATDDTAEKKRIIDELDNIIMPRMEAIAKSPRDYFLQSTRAMLLLRKGPSRLKDARDALVSAYMSNASAAELGDMILKADMELDDKEGAERHAREILRRNRQDPLANYVTGSIRLLNGNYTEAEVFLRKACAGQHPLAAAENDLAEVLRRLQRYDEAESFARRAVKTDPNLYVAWETLASTLLGAKKNLDEAEECMKKAIDLAKTTTKKGEDLRMQITLARVLLAQGEPSKRNQALGIVRALKKREKEFDSFDRDQINQLRKAAGAR